MNVIVIEQAGERPDTLAKRLELAGCRVVTRLFDASALERALEICDSDVIALDFDDPDPALLEAVGRLGHARGKTIVAFVDRVDPVALAVAVRVGIPGYVVRGSGVDRLCDELAVAKARFDADRTLREELIAMRTSLSERKVIERAKGRLMQIEGLDEPAAYRMLRDLAVRRNRRLIDVAEAILEHIEA